MGKRRGNTSARGQDLFEIIGKMVDGITDNQGVRPLAMGRGGTKSPTSFQKLKALSRPSLHLFHQRKRSRRRGSGNTRRS